MHQGPGDIRITVYDPTGASVLLLDASQYIGRGVLKYDDSPSGCEAATIPLIMRYEDVFALGVWAARNIVEISSGDNTLQTSTSHVSAGGTLKVYLDTNWTFDPAQGWVDDQLAYFWDGITLTMRCPVTSIGSDGGGPFIIVDTPLGGGDIPAYNALQTTVGRRRYSGTIVRRERLNQKLPDATLTCQGWQSCLSNASGNFVINQAAAVDIGSTIYQALKLFPVELPFLTVSSGNFPVVGQTFAGTYYDTGVDSFISDALKAVTANDNWTLRIGHDRTPRLKKLYTQSTVTYAYNLTVQQTSPPQAVLVDVADQDCSQFYTRIKVVGTVNPLTSQPYEAEAIDTAAETLLNGLAVQGPVTQIQGLTSVAQCASYAQALLDANSAAKSIQKLTVYTRANSLSGIALPGGAFQGDCLPPCANITCTGFNATDSAITPPDINGLPAVITTSYDCSTTEMHQELQFSAMMPPWSALLAEKANAISTALVSNSPTRAGLDQFFVDQKAYPFTWVGFVVTVPAFQAIFAQGSLPVNVGGNTFTLSANNQFWVWLNPNNTYTINTSSVAVAGAIPYGFFWTNGTTIQGSDELAAIGLIQIPIAYMLNGNPISVSASGIDITQGIAGAFSTPVNINVTINNQPIDGSLSKIPAYYRQVGQPDYLLLATSKPQDAAGNPLIGSQTSAVGKYTFLYSDAAKGISYEFGVAMESAASAETPVLSLGTFEIGNGINLIFDSDMLFAGYSGAAPRTATAATYWTFPGDAGFDMQENAGQQSNEMVVRNADAVGEHDCDSAVINVTPGQTYTVSCFIDSSAVV